MTYADWVSMVQGAGAKATTWPFQDDGMNAYGQPAAYFTNAQYQAYAGTDVVPGTGGVMASNSGQGVYILATVMTGSTDVLAGAPQVMDGAQQAENAIFTTGDAVADALGLPSLNTIENVLRGGLVTIGLAVAAFAYLEFRKRS